MSLFVTRTAGKCCHHSVLDQVASTYGAVPVSLTVTPPTGAVSINGGAQYTASPNVTLTAPAKPAAIVSEQMCMRTIMQRNGETQKAGQTSCHTTSNRYG